MDLHNTSCCFPKLYVIHCFLLYSVEFFISADFHGTQEGSSSFPRTDGTVPCLLGLIYYICEVYLDDIIVHGKTNEEFIFNLREVFKRMDRYNIKLKPTKCRFGTPKIETAVVLFLRMDYPCLRRK
jgi:hypothetical protein